MWHASAGRNCVQPASRLQHGTSHSIRRTAKNKPTDTRQDVCGGMLMLKHLVGACLQYATCAPASAVVPQSCAKLHDDMNELFTLTCKALSEGCTIRRRVRRMYAYARVYVYTRMGTSNYVSQLVTDANSATCLISSAYSRIRMQQRLQARYMSTSCPSASVDERLRSRIQHVCFCTALDRFV